MLTFQGGRIFQPIRYSYVVPLVISPITTKELQNTQNTSDIDFLVPHLSSHLQKYFNLSIDKIQTIIHSIKTTFNQANDPLRNNHYLEVDYANSFNRHVYPMMDWAPKTWLKVNRTANRIKLIFRNKNLHSSGRNKDVFEGWEFKADLPLKDRVSIHSPTSPTEYQQTAEKIKKSKIAIICFEKRKKPIILNGNVYLREETQDEINLRIKETRHCINNHNNISSIVKIPFPPKPLNGNLKNSPYPVAYKQKWFPSDLYAASTTKKVKLDFKNVYPNADVEEVEILHDFIPFDVAPKILLNICKTLKSLHINNYIHADVKGENILIDFKKGKYYGYLSDFDNIVKHPASDCNSVPDGRHYPYYDFAGHHGFMTRLTDAYGLAVTMSKVLLPDFDVNSTPSDLLVNFLHCSLTTRTLQKSRTSDPHHHKIIDATCDVMEYVLRIDSDLQDIYFRGIEEKKDRALIGKEMDEKIPTDIMDFLIEKLKNLVTS